MKTLLAALALAAATPAFAQAAPATDSHTGQAQHQQQGQPATPGQQQAPMNGQKDCCKDGQCSCCDKQRQPTARQGSAQGAAAGHAH